VDTYGEFADSNAELLKQLPPPAVAISYWEGADLYMFDEFQTAVQAKTRRPKVSPPALALKLGCGRHHGTCCVAPSKCPQHSARNQRKTVWFGRGPPSTHPQFSGGQFVRRVL
jgi:hypothetical protein